MRARYLIFVWLAFVLSHLWNVVSFPIFEDEAEYLLLADAIVKNPIHHFFIFSLNGLFPLYGWIVALFTFFLHDSLLSGRLVNVLFSSSLVFWIRKVSVLHRLPSKFEWFAQGLLITSPIILLNSRVSLLDTSVMVYTAWYIYFTDAYLKNRSRLSLLGLAGMFLAAMLTKATGVFGVPAAAFLIYRSLRKPEEKKRALIAIAVFVLTFLISLAYFSFFSGQISSDSGSSIFIPKEVFGFYDELRTRGWVTLNWFKVYYLPYFLTPFLFLIGRHKEKISHIYLTMSTWIFTALVIMISFNQFYYPRHILVLSVPLLVLLSLSISKVQRYIALIIFGLALIFQSNISLRIITGPQNAPLALEDKFEYFENYTSGVNLYKIASFLKGKAGQNTTVWVDGSYVMEYGLRRNIHSGNITIKSFRLNSDFIGGDPMEINGDGGLNFIVVNRWQPKNIHEMHLLADFPVSFRHSQYVYQLQ